MSKHIRSDNPRKANIVLGFKTLVGCDKVTLLTKEATTNNGETLNFRAHCLKYAGGKYDSLGMWTMSVNRGVNITVSRDVSA